LITFLMVEGARRRGYTVTFWEYARVGVPITIVTLAFGVWWLS
jgi:Na+/H+ antiporter NhaD/arsenite permease-like protein